MQGLDAHLDPNRAEGLDCTVRSNPPAARRRCATPHSARARHASTATFLARRLVARLHERFRIFGYTLGRNRRRGGLVHGGKLPLEPLIHQSGVTVEHLLHSGAHHDDDRQARMLRPPLGRAKIAVVVERAVAAAVRTFQFIGWRARRSNDATAVPAPQVTVRTEHRVVGGDIEVRHVALAVADGVNECDALWYLQLVPGSTAA